MPIYEYKCLECGSHIEIRQKISDDPLEVCDECGGKMEKQWSLSGFQFKGAGWYVTDYTDKKTGKVAETSEKGETALPEWVDGDVQNLDERVVLLHNWDEVKRTLWNYVGIVRSTKRLERARVRIRNLEREINDYYWNFKVDESLLELRNMIQVAALIVECALQRKESRGLHYTLDYPDKSDVALNSSIRI